MVEEAADYVWLFLSAVKVAAGAVEEFVWVAWSASGERGCGIFSPRQLYDRWRVMTLTIYGAAAVTFMMLMYAFERRGRRFILAYSGAPIFHCVSCDHRVVGGSPGGRDIPFGDGSAEGEWFATRLGAMTASTSTLPPAVALPENGNDQ